MQLFIVKKTALSREEADAILKTQMNGAFLIRWSTNYSTYVLSVLNSKTYHYSFTLEEDGRVRMETVSSIEKVFFLPEFVTYMMETCNLQTPVENIWGTLSINKRLTLGS